MLLCMAWVTPKPPPAPMVSSSRSHLPPCLLFCYLPLLSICLASLLPAPALADINGDAQALLAFKSSVTNAGNLISWNSSSTASVCTAWKGITCANVSTSTSSASSVRVLEIRLPGSSLVGSIPSQTLGKLDALQILSLRKNKLSGSLPSDLANCTALQQVNLQSNSFSGPLDFDFSAWSLLQKLDLSSNNFSGDIPPSLTNLTHLDSLFLEENSFSGPIPPLNTTSLQSFSVANNQLNGSIPLPLSDFSTDSFAGNLDLCGAPLAACPQSVESPPGAPQPTPSSGSNEAGDNEGNNNLSTGAIVGIVIGALAAAAITFSACFLFFARKNAKQAHSDDLYAGGRANFKAKTEGKNVKHAHSDNLYEGGRPDIETENKGTPIRRDAGGRSGQSEAVTVAINENKLTFVGNAKQTFDLDDLLRATAEMLGKGTLGTSYKADIDEGHPVCVKRFREVATDRDFTCRHIEMLGALKHPNLVSLRAYFFAPKGKLLVSDFIPKGSLSSLLHGNKREAREPMDWETRLATADDAAKGLVFLHSRKVVHGNIKSSNVVMNAEGQAHLSDYSLVQLVPLATEPEVTLKPSAYTPPECREDVRKITYKGDVYAFGVLLLELITGKSPNSGSLTKGGTNIDRLVQWVQAHFPQDMESVLDQRLAKTSETEVVDEMIHLLQIAMPCVSSLPEKRPHMVEVVSSISNLRKREVRPEATDFYFTQAE